MMTLFFMGSMTYWILIGWLFWLIWGIWWLFDIYLTGVYVEKNLQKDELKHELKKQDLEAQLKRLYELYEEGRISKAEFEARKEILFR